MLKLIVFIFNRAFNPVFIIQNHDVAALIKTAVTVGEVRFNGKAEFKFVGFDLEDRSVVISEMIIGPLS